MDPVVAAILIMVIGRLVRSGTVTLHPRITCEKRRVPPRPR